MRPHHQKETIIIIIIGQLKEALQKAIEFWATRAKCASVVLYFDIECERSARRYANEVMEIWAEGGKSNNTKRKEGREEKKRKDR